MRHILTAIASCVLVTFMAGVAFSQKITFEDIKRGDLDRIAQLIKDGADVNAKDGLYRTPLHKAASLNQLEIARLLISKGANVNYTDIFTKATPLHDAAESGFAELVRVLLNSGAGNNIRNDNGNTPLHLAVSEGRQDAVEVLLKSGANKNAQNDKGDTPLHLATEQGRTEIVKILLQASADPSVINTAGAQPLHLAALLDRKSIMVSFLKVSDRDALNKSDGEAIARLLRARRVQAESNHKKFNVPHLFAAASAGDVERVRELLEAKTDVNLRRRAGDTALHVAVDSGHESIVALLLDKGADPNASRLSGSLGRGEAPIHYAAREGRPAILKLLLERGADVNARTKDGETALHFAARENRIEVARLLVSCGANTATRDNDGKSPQAEAADWRHFKIVGLLKSR